MNAQMKNNSPIGGQFGMQAFPAGVDNLLRLIRVPSPRRAALGGGSFRETLVSGTEARSEG
jgi:hypothetical protein